jgi:hypothetical protein
LSSRAGPAAEFRAASSGLALVKNGANPVPQLRFKLPSARASEAEVEVEVDDHAGQS